MNKKSVVVLVMTTFIVAVLVALAAVVFVFDVDFSGEKPDEQKILIEKDYFNTKTEKNGSIHIISTGCKIYYQERYKSEVDEALESCTEDINAMIGEYFRNQDLADISQDNYFDKSEIYIKDEINGILNDRIDNRQEMPIEYITEVVLFNTVYQ